MSDLQTLRPKLKQNTVFIETADGILFQQNESAFLVKGKAAARWIARLAPHLTGERTLEELCEGFEPALRDMVVRLVSALLQKGVLKNEVPEAPDLLPEVVERRFRSQIEFIDHYVDAPRKRFKTFRESRVALVGSGEGLTALASSMLRNGLRDLFLVPTDGSSGSADGVVAEAETLRQDGLEVDISLLDFGSFANDLDTYEIIAFCTENAAFKEMALLNQRCIAAQRPFLPAWTFAGRTFIGPLVRPPGGPCWLCAQMRLSARMEGGHSAALWKAMAIGDDPSGEASTLYAPISRHLGNSMAFELFKLLSGVLPSEAEDGVLIQEIETMESHRGALLRHPLCPVCSRRDLASDIDQLSQLVADQEGRQFTPGEMLEKGANLINPYTGVFSAFEDDDLVQVPLRQTRLEIGLSPHAAELGAIAYSIDTLQAARSEALLEAVKMYTQALPDKRGIVTASLEEMEEQDKEVLPAHLFSHWTGNCVPEPGVRLEWIPAFSLLRQRLCYVPAAGVYPLTSLNRQGLFERIAVGSVVGTTFQDERSAGIISALGYEHLRDLVRGHEKLVEFEVEEGQFDDPDLLFLVKSAKRFACKLLMLDSPSPLHVVLASTREMHRDSLCTMGAGLSHETALRQALLKFVGALQRLQRDRSNIQPFPGMLPRWMEYLAGIEARRVSTLRKPAATISQIEEYLREQNYDILFVDTTTPDIRESTPFLSGIVLLAHPMDAK